MHPRSDFGRVAPLYVVSLQATIPLRSFLLRAQVQNSDVRVKGKINVQDAKSRYFLIPEIETLSIALGSRNPIE